MKQFILLVAISLCSTVSLIACTCRNVPPDKVEEYRSRDFKTYQAVFYGKAIGFEYREGVIDDFSEHLLKIKGGNVTLKTKLVKFEVKRWWNMSMGNVAFIATDDVIFSDPSQLLSSGVSVGGCDYNFKEGETYVVYATGKADALRTSSCSMTFKVEPKAKLPRFLSHGKKPNKTFSDR